MKPEGSLDEAVEGALYVIDDKPFHPAVSRAPPPSLIRLLLVLLAAGLLGSSSLHIIEIAAPLSS